MNTDTELKRQKIICEFTQKYINQSYTYNNIVMEKIARNNNTPIEITEYLLNHPSQSVKKYAKGSYSYKKSMVTLYNARLKLESIINGSQTFDSLFLPGYPDWVIYDWLYDTGQIERCFDESKFNPPKVAIELCEPVDNYELYAVLVFGASLAALATLLLCYN